MRDSHDKKTLELPVIPVPARRGRKPAGEKVKDAAARKREQRIRQAEVVQGGESEAWTEAECLAVLQGARWRGEALDKAAWLQLGRLRGFL